MEDIFKIGDKVVITDKARAHFKLPKNVEYTIEDILEDEVNYKYMLKAEEYLGKYWVQFFTYEEIRPIKVIKTPKVKKEPTEDTSIQR